MMTLVLNTHMKLKAGMVERKITADQGQMPEVQGREIAARCTADL